MPRASASPPPGDNPPAARTMEVRKGDPDPLHPDEAPADPATLGEAAEAAAEQARGLIEPTQTVKAAERRAPRLTDTLTPLGQADEYLNVLWFGQESTGKTTDLARMANLPGDGIVIIINAEAGLKKRALAQQGVDVSRIVLWPPKAEPGKPQLKVSYANLDRLQRQIATQLRDEPGSVAGVGFDSLTEISILLLDGAVQRAIKKYETTGKGRGGDSDEFDVEQSDWGVMTSQVKKLLGKYRDLPCHFGATALERVFEAKHGDSNVDQIGPDLNPGLAGKVLGFFDVCIRVTADTLTVGQDQTEAILKGWTKKTKTIRAKDRENAFPASVPEPTFDRLVRYASGELTLDLDDRAKAHNETRAKKAAYLASKTASTPSTTPTKEK